MIKTVLFSTAMAFCLYFTASAQSDTSHYDLGRVFVKKDFTQSITIKGGDLERYQFSDLADAINVWLYGTYSNSGNLVYVINGNIITDVNAYSIYDIDEITLAQNAVAQVSGASPGALMVLIKLKNNQPGAQGIRVAGQTSLVNMANRQNTTGEKSTTNVYDHYYVGAYKNLPGVHFGLSADYQHDVLPILVNSNYQKSTLDPFHFNRFKFTGYADAKLWSGTTASFGINYVPQTSGAGLYYVQQEFEIFSSQKLNSGVAQHLANTNLAINSNITTGLTNTLSFAYSHYNYFESDSLRNVSQSPQDLQNESVIRSGVFMKTSNLLIRDNLAYHTHIGVFDVEPALNFSYRHFKNLTVDSTLAYQVDFASGPPSISEQKSGFGYDIKLYLLTPSVTISYKDAFSLQAGYVNIVNSGSDFTDNFHLQRLSPFVTASINPFKFTDISNINLRFFGSFSRQNQILNDDYATLAGIGLSGTLTNINVTTLNGTTAPLPQSTVSFNDSNPYHQYNNYQAGFVLMLAKNLEFSYSYTDDYSQDAVIVLLPNGANGSQESEATYYDKQIINRVGLNYNLQSKAFSWRTGLNAAQEKVQVVGNTYLESADYNNYLNNGHRYSGGFTNRFEIKSFFAGLDILYRFGERPITLSETTPAIFALTPVNTNSVALQSIYLGTQLKISHVKYAEVFASARNILQNKTSDITNNVRYYGLGFKMGW